MNKIKNIKSVAVTAVFTALTAAFSQVAFPTPIGISVTLQTFIIAVTAFLLGPIRAVACVVCYIIIGALSLPVFTGFSGGVGVILGPTGGFILAFPAYALILAFVLYVNQKAYRVLLTLAALITLYTVGAAQFVFVTGNSLKVAISAFSLYFAKDALTVLAAYFLCVRIRPILSKFIQLK